MEPNKPYIVTCCPFPQSTLDAEVIVYAQNADAALELFYKTRPEWTVKSVKEQ